MKILLDENFPLRLVRSLATEGHDAEHIILLGQRGASDRAIVERLNSEDLVFFTNDRDFLAFPLGRSTIVVSRVSQALPIDRRIAIWLGAVRQLMRTDSGEKRLEVGDDGKLSPLSPRGS